MKKRPVSLEEIDRMVDEIEADILNSLDREVASYRIGEMAMEKLKQVDEVAYVRFASVYRQFADINTFMNELKTLFKKKNRTVFASGHLISVEAFYFFSKEKCNVFLCQGTNRQEGGGQLKDFEKLYYLHKEELYRYLLV